MIRHNSKARTARFALACTLGVALAACGTPSATDEVSGVVASEDALTGTVSLKDGATPVNERTTRLGADGSFSFDVRGLVAPFLLKVEGDGEGGARLYAASSGGRTNVNAITTAAVAASDDDEKSDESYERGDRDRRFRTARDFLRALDDLRVVLAPLFERYGVTADPFTDEGQDAALRALLADIRVSVHDGRLVITNRATGAVIFTGRVRRLSEGTFHPENMPAGPGTQPPGACTYAYAAWGSCQANGTQTRTVASSTPAGCTGTPVLSQACTYVPPPPTSCSYAYSGWGACQANGTQSRTLTSSVPAGCTGTPVLSQACTYVPPVSSCTYGYSAWGACQANGTQSRTVTTSTPAGCTGTPVVSQACTYVPPACTYTYSAWGACQSTGRQTRTVATTSPAGCTGTPATSQACTYVPPALDGAALYQQSCSSCHGSLASSSVRGRTASQITSAGMTRGLSPAQVQAVADALK